MDVLKNCSEFDYGFSNQSVGGKLWLLWKDGLEVSVSQFSAQHVSVLLKVASHSVMVYVVYAKCTHMEGRDLWRLLQLDVVQDIPWLCLGDFNIICGDDERSGGRPRSRIAMGEFNDFIEACGLTEIKSMGAKFSLCNGQ